MEQALHRRSPQGGAFKRGVLNARPTLDKRPFPASNRNKPPKPPNPPTFLGSSLGFSSALGSALGLASALACVCCATSAAKSADFFSRPSPSRYLAKRRTFWGVGRLGVGGVLRQQRRAGVGPVRARGRGPQEPQTSRRDCKSRPRPGPPASPPLKPPRQPSSQTLVDSGKNPPSQPPPRQTSPVETPHPPGCSPPPPRSSP